MLSLGWSWWETEPLAQAFWKEGLSVAWGGVSFPGTSSKGLSSDRELGAASQGHAHRTSSNRDLMPWLPRPSCNGALHAGSPPSGALGPGPMVSSFLAFTAEMAFPIQRPGVWAHSVTGDPFSRGLPLSRAGSWCPGTSCRSGGVGGALALLLLLTAGYHLPRSEAGERAAGLRGPHRPHRLRA